MIIDSSTQEWMVSESSAMMAMRIARDLLKQLGWQLRNLKDVSLFALSWDVFFFPNNIPLESRKMFVGPIENDTIMLVKIGDRLRITNNEQQIGKKGVIAVRNCTAFSEELME